MEKFRGKYRIESTRLKGWDYSNPGYYFVTICTKNREHFFGRVEKGKMLLSDIGNIIHLEWLQTQGLRQNVRLDAFQIMPDHMHGIVIITHRIENLKNNIAGKIDCVDNKNGDVIADPRCNADLSSAPSPIHYETADLQLPSAPPTPKQPNPFPAFLKPEQYFKQSFNNRRNNKFGPQKNNFSSIVGGFKSASTVKIRKIFPHFGWQRLFDDHVIRNSGEFYRIRNYILNNPRNGNSDNHFQ